MIPTGPFRLQIFRGSVVLALGANICSPAHGPSLRFSQLPTASLGTFHDVPKVWCLMLEHPKRNEQEDKAQP